MGTTVFRQLHYDSILRHRCIVTSARGFNHSHCSWSLIGQFGVTYPLTCKWITKTVKSLFECWVIFHDFCRLPIFSKSSLSENSFRNTCTIRVSNSLNPDQARHFVGPDLDPNCLQMLSADDTSRQRVKPGTNREVLLVKKSFLYFIQIPIPWPARIRIHRFRVQEPFYAYRSTELVT